MEEYRSCDNCKYEELTEHEAPCVSCKNAQPLGSADEKSAPFLWEPVDAAEAVEHPAHYNQGKFECIDVMLETFGKEATQHFCLLNAFKYIWRTGEKNGVEDVKKARWYLDKYLELEGEADE